MSIFSSLFSRETEDDYELEAGQSTDGKTGQSNSATTGELCEGMRIDVTTPDGTPLLAGKITALTSTTLTLERLPGGLAFKICSLEAAVCASGYDKKMIPISLRATVQESTRTLLKLKNVQVEAPVRIGDVIVKDIADTGVKVVATKNVELSRKNT